VSLDPYTAALWAIIAICLVLLGALITPGTLAVEQRGPVLAGIVTVLLAIGWRVRRRPPRDGDE
jgi:hypothetical protein